MTTEGEINAKVVDNSSVLYQFAKENLAQDNVFYLDTEGKPNDESSFRYYINMPKVKLAMLNPSTGVEESDTALSTGTARTTDNNYGNKIVEIRTDKKDSGVYTLRYRFRIDSSVDASVATVYHAGLYFDMNADVNLSKMIPIPNGRRTASFLMLPAMKSTGMQQENIS